MNLLTANSAFELLRSFKEVSEDTEKLVLAIVSRKHKDLTIKELSKIFESGIAGEYGKIYTLDPQTILSWIDKYEKNKNSAKDYLDSPLLPVWWPGKETHDWLKEANKCYKAFLNGVSSEYFHHCVYDRMMLDDKIKLNAYRKYYSVDVDYESEEIKAAKRKILKDVFQKMKDQGLTYVYFIK